MSDRSGGEPLSHERARKSPWWTTGLIMIVLLLMARCSANSTEVRSDDTLADYIGRYDQRLAQSRVDRYRAALGLTLPVVVSVEAESTMPPRTDAHTTRTWEAEGPAGCTVHVTSISVQRASVLAHEICHCKLDYRVLGTWGYVDVSAEQRRVRERAAVRCEDELMKRSAW